MQLEDCLSLVKTIPGWRLINTEARQKRFYNWIQTFNPDWPKNELRIHLEIAIRQACNPEYIPF